MAEQTGGFGSMAREKKLAVVGLIAMAVSCFLPYVSFETFDEDKESLSLLDIMTDDYAGDDRQIYVFLLILIAAGGAYFAYSSQNAFALLAAGLAAGALLWAAISFSGTDHEFAYYLSILAAAVGSYGALKTVQAEK